MKIVRRKRQTEENNSPITRDIDSWLRSDRNMHIVMLLWTTQQPSKIRRS